MVYSKERVISEINEHGYIIIPDVLSPEFIKECKAELHNAVEVESKKYGAVGAKDYAMVMLCSLYGGTFNRVFDNEKLMMPFNAILGDRSIVYAYTSSSMPPNAQNYSTRIHVDCPRIIPDYITNMGATIALDDFTEDNGATYFLPGSQTRAETPSPEEFKAKAKRFVAPAGSVFFFNARIWHSGGVNKTDKWRHALTFNMCRSYMKQRIDIPRAMSGMNTDSLSENAKQKLGFYSQPPSSMEEYYLPPEKRTFRHAAE